MKFGRVRGDDVLRSSIQCRASQWAQRMAIRPIWCRSLSSLPSNGRRPLGKFVNVALCSSLVAHRTPGESRCFSSLRVCFLRYLNNSEEK